MKIAELKVIIETMEDLGHTDVNLVLDDSRDGQDSYPKAKAYVVKTDDQCEPCVMLAFGYE